MKSKGKCYFCGKTASTKEHVPPKCIFPDQEDAENNDFRINLITVPSCVTHNSETSQDDEYFFFIMVMNIKTNEVCQKYLQKKFQRALKRKKSLQMYKSFFKDPKKVMVRENQNMTYNKSSIYKIDLNRYNRIIRKIIKALFFKHFRSRLSGIIKIITNGLLFSNEGDHNQYNRDMYNFEIDIENQMSTLKMYGDNPQVFSYKTEQNKEGTLFWLTFFSGFKILVQIIH